MSALMPDMTSGGEGGRREETIPGISRLRAQAGLGRRWAGAWLGLVLAAAGAGLRSEAATFVVSNTLNSGVGSLREAMLNANSSNGLDKIIFRIPGKATHTILPHSALPAVTDPVVIDGTTQPGFAGSPLIELDGASAGGGNGLHLLSSNCVVCGLVINRFAGGGVRIEGLGNHWIRGNFIGLDVSGTLSRANGGEGIYVYSSQGNVIGGTNAADRNVISASSDCGVYLYSAPSNAVLGNFIGTTANGRTRLGNANNGVLVLNSSGNLIGGATPGATNILAGNGGSGVLLQGPGANGNVVQGNYIGTDVTGSMSLSNAGDGISIVEAASNLIGGTGARAGNVILANSHAGILVDGAGATNNVVQGNSIGARPSGRQALGNSYAGITIENANANLIGGTVPGAANLILGNQQDGIFITNGVGNLVQGNRIGVDGTGAGTLGNAYSGVTISGGLSNAVGGTLTGAGNVISGNRGHGVALISGTTANLVQGNWIGTDAGGQTSLTNGMAGVYIQSPGNTIGGALTGARNVISGNGLDGLQLDGATATGNVVAGNLIGTDSSGTAPLPNGLAAPYGASGLFLSDAPGNRIGGATPGAGNLISANSYTGISIVGSGSSGTLIQGNKIGTDLTGTARLGNFYDGIYIESASTNVIGGAAPGAGNLISGNGASYANGDGIYMTNSCWNVIQGNWIGTKSDGVANLCNIFHGVECEAGANYNLIGGDANAGNRIAYAHGDFAGVRIRDGAACDSILGNAIFANGALGINLGQYGVWANLPCDAGVGAGAANLGQNYPVLSNAVAGPNGTGVSGTLNTRPNGLCRVQFFAEPMPDLIIGQDHGEGQVYLGEKTVSTGADCNGSFLAFLTNPVPAVSVITATATDAQGNTSEFSLAVPVQAVPALSMTSFLWRGRRASGPAVGPALLDQ